MYKHFLQPTVEAKSFISVDNRFTEWRGHPPQMSSSPCHNKTILPLITATPSLQVLLHKTLLGAHSHIESIKAKTLRSAETTVGIWGQSLTPECRRDATAQTLSPSWKPRPSNTSPENGRPPVLTFCGGAHNAETHWRLDFGTLEIRWGISFHYSEATKSCGGPKTRKPNSKHPQQVKVSFICKTHSPPYTPLPSPKDPAHIYSCSYSYSQPPKNILWWPKPCLLGIAEHCSQCPQEQMLAL